MSMTVPAIPALPRTFRYTQPMQRGDDVRQLQELLRRVDPQGAGRELTSVDGLFGPATRRAAMAFQTRAGLADVDGVVGPDSWAALWLAANSSITDLNRDRAGLDRAIADSQRRNGAGGVLAESLAGLQAWHSAYSDGIRWRLTVAGVELENEALPGAGLEPVAVRRAFDWFGPAFRAVATATEVPVELLVATACTEVLGATRTYDTPDKAARAVREEPGFISDAATPHRVSPGLMQTLISTAQQMMPEIPVSRDSLSDPAEAIRAGALYIRSQAGKTRLDPPLVAAAYNAGGVYRQAGPANRWKMRQFPIGTGHHADRFVIFFNQAMRLVAVEPALIGAGTVPSFWRRLAA